MDSLMTVCAVAGKLNQSSTAGRKGHLAPVLKRKHFFGHFQQNKNNLRLLTVASSGQAQDWL
jgi:hypothetical protein